MLSDPVPQLRVVTRALDEAPDLVGLADRHAPLLWLRDGSGCVGLGEALRLRFSGSHRFEDAARAWRGIVDAASVDDAVQRPGSGLTALGTFTFDDSSAAESVLIVPRTLVATDGEASWVTETQLVAADSASDPAPLAANFIERAESGVSDPLKPHFLPSRRNGGDAEAGLGTWEGTEFAATEGSLTAYLDGVSVAVRRIAEGSADKIVLARQVVGAIDEDADLRVPLARLAERYTECCTFAVDGLLGASPETLIRSARGKLSARVLAGTRRRRTEDETRDIAERDELLASPKEQQEHAFAVQSVVTALSPTCAASR